MTVSTASFLSFLSFPFFPPFSLLSSLYHVDVASPGPDRDTPGQAGGEGRAGREGDRPVPCRAGLGLRKRPADRQTDGRSGRQTGAPSVRTRFKRAADRQRARIMAAACLSRAR